MRTKSDFSEIEPDFSLDMRNIALEKWLPGDSIRLSLTGNRNSKLETL